MANESALIVRQQGGSELSVRSGGSINVESGGRFSLNSGAAKIGGVSIFSGRNSPHNTLAGSPGDVFFRSDGSVSNLYVNIGSGVTAQSWASAVEVL